jgi:hypothetical protein
MQCLVDSNRPDLLYLFLVFLVHFWFSPVAHGSLFVYIVHLEGALFTLPRRYLLKIAASAAIEHRYVHRRLPPNPESEYDNENVPHMRLVIPAGLDPGGPGHGR